MKELLSRQDSLLYYMKIILFSGLILYFGQSLLIPLSFGLLIAIVLFPVCQKLEHKGWPRGLAITTSLLLVFIIFAALIVVILIQMDVLLNALPTLQRQAIPLIDDLHIKLEQLTGVTVKEQSDWFHNTMVSIGQNLGSYLSQILNATVSIFFYLIIIPIYSFLFLYNRKIFIQFVQSFVDETLRSKIDSILLKTVNTYSSYVRGMVMVYLVVGILNTLGLMAIGVENALLYGMLTAIMTIIPYFGIIVSAMLPITFSWTATGSIVQPISIVLVFTFVQYLEANFIFPYIAGRHLKLNTWATIVSIFLGGIVWGVAGMVLFLPFVAVFNLIADEWKELKSINILLSREEE